MRSSGINKMIGTLDIEIYKKAGDDGLVKNWAQAKYLAHGFEDVLWTDDLDEALAFLKQSIIDEERNLTTASIRLKGNNKSILDVGKEEEND